MKTEVLKSIKKTEEEYRQQVDAAMAERERIITNARLEADNLVAKAANVTEEYKKKRLADARNDAAKEHARVLEEGKQQAAALKEKGRKRMKEAVSLFVERFKERVHVTA
ncbi:MAG: ATPase [Methanocalculus sp. MSAO_Arc2]|uniref:ATPase n=1 Tax=Methanocalculus sp. MSAO_Arc2 TaxID=2293855 RepID=UPI000FF34E32|nr:MAG: ATPase [Methanocalculus sp. MSAO_Arc2]